MHSTSYITALRFPLALLVVFIHTYNTAWQSIDNEVFSTVATLCSRLLPACAVPLFFCISGYLFFKGYERFTLEDYANKLRRRAFTLLIPYLAWNLIAFALYALKDVAAGTPLQTAFSPDIFWGCRLRGADFTNWLGITVQSATAPVQMPLWFVRDLMVIVLCTPAIHCLLRKLGTCGLLLLGAIFYTQTWPNTGGFSFQGVWFFSLGAWFGMKGISPAAFAGRYNRYTLLPMLAALAYQLLCPHPSSLGSTLANHIYVLSAMLCAIRLASRFAQAHTPSKLLAESSYFLYASHTIALLPLYSVLSTAAQGQSWPVQLLLYLLCPFTATLICLGTFCLLRKYLPRSSRWLTGIYRS